jgi:hypothetical protein
MKLFWIFDFGFWIGKNEHSGHLDIRFFRIAQDRFWILDRAK